MAPQIMWPEMNAYHAACFGHHFPCGFITNRKNALMGLNVFFSVVIFQPIGEPLGNKDEFFLPTTLGLF
jgi:hypothetical protein